MSESRGVIYYNIGLKMLVRLSCSINSLRRIYSGNVSILADEIGYPECKVIGNHFGVDVVKVNLTKDKKNAALLNKCLLHTVTPYDISIFIDSDTIVYKPFFELFDLAKIHGFVTTSFSNWTTKRGTIYRRIKAWRELLPNYMDNAMKEAPAINTGTFAFRKDSTLMKDWYDVAVQRYDSYIPDETACQVILHRYPNLVVSKNYNTSCKYDSPLTDEKKILHFHGRKHCRINHKGEYEYNSNLWFDEFRKIMNLDFVRTYTQHDPQLRRYIQRWQG